MSDQYASMFYAPLDAETRPIQPPQPPLMVTMESPAREVMTDFSYVNPIVTTPHVAIDDALLHMRESQVRSLLVVDESGYVIGLVTSNDIQGAKPIRIIEQSRMQRQDIKVSHVMTPQSAISVVNMVSVLGAKVGHVVATLRKLELRHLIVVQWGREIINELPEAKGNEPFAVHEWSAVPESDLTSHSALPQGKQWIRGLFSASQISRQIGIEVTDVMTSAHSLSDVMRKTGK